VERHPQIAFHKKNGEKGNIVGEKERIKIKKLVGCDGVQRVVLRRCGGGCGGGWLGQCVCRC
jgi:hypothetical protein